jgi:hypothetical protein
MEDNRVKGTKLPIRERLLAIVICGKALKIKVILLENRNYCAATFGFIARFNNHFRIEWKENIYP